MIPYRGIAVAGCAPEEMGIGPVFAVPKRLKLKTHGLKIDDIGVWEINEAYACQALYCRDRLGIDPARSVSTAAASRSRIRTDDRLAPAATHQARNPRYVVVTMCIGGGMGAAGLFDRVGRAMGRPHQMRRWRPLLSRQNLEFLFDVGSDGCTRPRPSAQTLSRCRCDACLPEMQ